MPVAHPSLDLTGAGTTLRDFAAAKRPSKDTQRYLVAAYWLKEFGASPTITTDKVYACYKAADWPLDIDDWDVTFRGQLKPDLFWRGEKGEYVITPGRECGEGTGCS